MKRKEYTKGQWKHLGHGPVDLFSRTGQLPMYTDDPDLIANEALSLLRFFKFDVLDLRGMISCEGPIFSVDLVSLVKQRGRIFF